MLLIGEIHDDGVGCPSSGPFADRSVPDGTATSSLEQGRLEMTNESPAKPPLMLVYRISGVQNQLVVV
jgi:hypothetical protein